MGTIVYYLPTGSVINKKKITEAGLSYILPHGTGMPEYTTTQQGPDGKLGVIFAFQGKDKMNLNNLAQTVEWKQIPKSDAWFGIDKENPPGPKDLERAKMKESYPVELSDGNIWLVPIIRNVDGSTELEKRLEHDGDSWIEVGVRAEHEALFTRASEIWEQFIAPLLVPEEEDAEATEDADIAITLGDGWDFAVDALALNYRISVAEISMLGLFDSDTATSAVMAAIDWLRWKEFQKKNEAEGGLDLSAGGQD